MTIEDALHHLNSIPSYYIELGVITTHSGRKHTVTASVGITNAELMFIHEFGSPLNNIPARPVLQMTLQWARQTLINKSLSKALELYLESFELKKFEEELERMCLKIERYARKLIYSNDGRLAPNAPSTVAAKGFNHPLFQTGQLARSITCRLVKAQEGG